MLKIDAHVHWNIEREAYLDLMDDLELRLLNVSVARDAEGQWRRDGADRWRKIAETNPDRACWVTSFDLPSFENDGYADRVIDGLDADFAAGAVACKVWKNIGMEVRKPDGSWLMIDDPIFDPILEHLAREHVPLLAHIAEPLACWQPAEPPNPHSGYYAAHPEWHFYGRRGVPSHSEIIAARDRMLAKHPRLKVIGAHLGSLEYDLAEIAHRLDQFPNFAVDTSARMWDLGANRPRDVQDFLSAYRTRVLWGTDTVNTDASTDPEELRRRYLREYRYYETADTIESPIGSVQGIGLPEELLERLYHKNAFEWYPRIWDAWQAS